MRSAVPRTARFSTRARLSAAAVACALLVGAGSISATAATSASGASRESGTALKTALGTSDDLQATAIAAYQTLEKAGAVHPS
jgi:hypothetical protein